ncbi:MAG TPA: non-homologous end-joining DNA ligase [Myxococcota bacterium]|nr:non-homologous end-joining DNA ligase [Myxococcota bacterium]
MAMRPIAPMLATLVPQPFHAAGWVYEEKYDGIRALAVRRARRVRVYSRNRLELTAEFPEIARALESLPGGDFTLDGEIVSFDARGVSRFQRLQRRGAAAASRPRFALFDCLERDGTSLVSRPLSERRRALEALVPARRGVLLRARRLVRNGLAAYRIAQERGWEGIVAKDEASRYEPGRRSKSWLKVKARREAEFLIGGWTPPKGSRSHFGALLLGLLDGRRLRYVGKVGAGFTHQTLEELYAEMLRLETPASVFDPLPRERGARWLRPQLVAQIAFAEWTADDKLRQPVFLGLRRDKKPSEITWASRER